MSPSAIAAKVKEHGLSGFALCDHNSAENCPAAERAAKKLGLIFIPGLEVCSSEEAHLLCLFDNVETALGFSGWIYDRLLDIRNIPEKLGDQVVVNEFEEIENEVPRYLGQATSAPINEILAEVHFRNGLCAPAHIDRPVFSVISQLGFLDRNDYDAVELSSHAVNNPLFDRSIAADYPVISGSDAHYLSDIGRAFIELDLDEISTDSLRSALRHRRRE